MKSIIPMKDQLVTKNRSGKTRKLREPVTTCPVISEKPSFSGLRDEAEFGHCVI
jgi:hypothetical protein